MVYDRDVLYFMKGQAGQDENQTQNENKNKNRQLTPEEIMLKAQATPMYDEEEEQTETQTEQTEQQDEHGMEEEKNEVLENIQNTETQTEQTTETQEEEEVDITELDKILELAKDLDTPENEIGEKAEAVKEAAESGDEEELLKAIQDLETELQNTIIEKDQYRREKELLLQKLQEYQDKVSDYETKLYEYNAYSKAFEDPAVKGFIKMIALYKANPESFPKERLIDAFDRISNEVFGVSISDVLTTEAEKQRQSMMGGNEGMAVNRYADDEEINPFEEIGRQILGL